MSMEIIHSPAFLDKRKFYTFLPLLVLPFLTVIYWAVGIKIIFKNQTQQNQPEGFNTSLPDPRLKDDEHVGKLAFYNQAQRDSAKRTEMIKKDPYRNIELTDQAQTDENKIAGLAAPFKQTSPQQTVSYQGKSYQGSHEIKMIKKLKKLDSVLAASSEPDFKNVVSDRQHGPTPSAKAGSQDIELRRIEELMAGSGHPNTQPDQDPEIRELSQLLEKVLDIQHPERVKERLKQQAVDSEAPAYRVSLAADESEISLLKASGKADSTALDAAADPHLQNRFYSLDDDVSASSDNAITAVIHEDQTVVSGSVIKIRLTSDIYVAGTLIPKNSFVFGTASINGERLSIAIQSVKLGNSLFSVTMKVYDLDGMEGIYIPGAISREVGKQSMSQQIQGLSIASLDPSLGAQAASAGIQAAKTLFSRKARLVQVTVKAGYQILLKSGGH
jgi:conjugative transposon TraM protein